MTVCCPHCQAEQSYPALPALDPSMRTQIQDLSCFRIQCPNCGQTMLALQPCLYHDREARFMVWLAPERENLPDFPCPIGYVLRCVCDLNSFREKINVLECGLDDRAVELMKLLLLGQLRHDLDVVELVFHALDAPGRAIRFAAVLSDGAEQYAAMPLSVYQQLLDDVTTYLYTSRQGFVCIDLAWASETLRLLHELHTQS